MFCLCQQQPSGAVVPFTRKARKRVAPPSPPQKHHPAHSSGSLHLAEVSYSSSPAFSPTRVNQSLAQSPKPAQLQHLDLPSPSSDSLHAPTPSSTLKPFLPPRRRQRFSNNILCAPSSSQYGLQSLQDSARTPQIRAQPLQVEEPAPLTIETTELDAGVVGPATWHPRRRQKATRQGLVLPVADRDTVQHARLAQQHSESVDAAKVDAADETAAVDSHISGAPTAPSTQSQITSSQTVAHCTPGPPFAPEDYATPVRTAHARSAQAKRWASDIPAQHAGPRGVAVLSLTLTRKRAVRRSPPRSVPAPFADNGATAQASQQAAAAAAALDVAWQAAAAPPGLQPWFEPSTSIQQSRDVTPPPVELSRAPATALLQASTSPSCPGALVQPLARVLPPEALHFAHIKAHSTPAAAPAAPPVPHAAPAQEAPAAAQQLPRPGQRIMHPALRPRLSRSAVINHTSTAAGSRHHPITIASVDEHDASQASSGDELSLPAPAAPLQLPQSTCSSPDMQAPGPTQLESATSLKDMWLSLVSDSDWDAHVSTDLDEFVNDGDMRLFICIHQPVPGGHADVYEWLCPLDGPTWSRLSHKPMPVATVTGHTFLKCPLRAGPWHNFPIIVAGGYDHEDLETVHPNCITMRERRRHNARGLPDLIGFLADASVERVYQHLTHIARLADGRMSGYQCYKLLRQAWGAEQLYLLNFTKSRILEVIWEARCSAGMAVLSLQAQSG